MNKLFIAGCLFVLALFTQTTQAQSLDEIVNKHIEAVGGKDNWMKVKSLKTSAVLKAQGAEINMTIWQVHKKSMRVDIEVMGMKGYQILTDKEGWGFAPWGGQTKAEPSTPDQVKDGQEQLDILDEFITYKDLGKTLELIGKDDVEGTECFKLVMTEKSGKTTTYYLDASNYQVIKETSKGTIDGKEFEANTMHSNYKKQDIGVVMPMNQNGDMGDMEFTKFEFNPKIDENLFKPSTN